MEPVATTSDVGLPDIVPNSAEENTATLAGTADRPARDRRREVEKEIPASGLLQERPKHDKQECIGCRNTNRNAKKAVGGVYSESLNTRIFG